MSEACYIEVKNQIELIHCWPKAPVEVGYLRHLHRHVFTVYSTIEVFHDDRELEFIQVQHHLKWFLGRYNFQPSVSCEQIARIVAQHILDEYGERNVRVSVFEDNENGATVKIKKESV